MNDITEQRTMTETVAPQADSELHKIPVLKDEEELIEMSTDFNLEEFQVVRREFFAHIREPAVTFNNRKFYVNSACLTKFPHTDYVQALINPHTKILALRPCGENERGSFQWCSIGQGKRKPRQTTCTLFFLKMFDMMDWNPDHRYKMLGNIIRANGEYLIAFDLTSTEVYQRTYDAECAKSTASRTPVYPIGWQNQFGMTLNEHKQSMLVNIFDGYAIYSIKENKAVRQSPTATVTADTVALPEGEVNHERTDSTTSNYSG